MNNVLALQEDITKDVEPDARVALDTTEAGAAASLDGSKVDELSGNSLFDATNGDREGWERGAARESVASGGVVVLGSPNLRVVCADDGVIKKHKSGASVEDTAEGSAAAAGSNTVAGGREAPESLAVIGIDISDRSGILGVVNETEVVGTGSVVLKSDGEEGAGQLVVDGIEEGSLRLGRDGVDGAECQTEQAIGVHILAELSRHRLGSLNSLRSSCHGTNGHCIGIYLAAGTRAIAIGDLP